MNSHAHQNVSNCRVLVHLARRLAQGFRHQTCRPQHVLIVLLRNSGDFFEVGEKTFPTKELVHYLCISIENDPTFDEAQEALPLMQRSLSLEVQELEQSGENCHESLFVALVSMLPATLQDAMLKTATLNKRGCLEQGDVFHTYEAKKAGAPKTKTNEKLRKKINKLSFLEIVTIPESLDSIANYEEDLFKTIHVSLQRRTKNSVLLIGESGVGKTKMMHRFVATHMDSLAYRQRLFVEINSAAIFSDISLRGQLETKVNQLLQLAREYRQQIVFLVDEIHIILGNKEIGHLIKQELANGTLAILGTTTPSDSRSLIEKDQSIVRRFNRVEVKEPNVKVAAVMVRQFLEVNFPKAFSDAANNDFRFDELGLAGIAEYAVELSKKFIPNRNLPDKAVDLVDYAMSKARLYSEAGAAIALSHEDLELALSEMMQIPVEKVRRQYAKILRSFHGAASQKLFGQAEPIKEVELALENHFLFGASKTPMLLFAGPSGVGKTELARVLAKSFYSDTEKAFLKLDMSEFSEATALAKLLGGAPGYVGQEAPGQLTEPVRTHGQKVVVLDELDKAHSSVLPLLLQLADDGFIHDAYGRRVDFRNTIVVATGNWPVGSSSSDVRFELRGFLPPELIGRLTATVLFKTPDVEAFEKLCTLQFEQICKTLVESPMFKGMTFTAGAGVLAKLSRRYRSVSLGVRAMRRELEHTVLGLLKSIPDRPENVTSYRIEFDRDGELIIKQTF